MHQQNTIKTRTGHPSTAASHSAPFRGHKNRQMRCYCNSYKRRKLCGQSVPVSRHCSRLHMHGLSLWGQITYKKRWRQRVKLELVRNLMAHGDAREGKWKGNWRMEWVASTLTPPPNMVYPALLTLMRTRLNWRPHRFKRTRPFRGKTKSGFCACAITFRTSYTYENNPKFVATEAEIVRICSTNWVQKSAYENLIKRTQLKEVIMYRLHVRPSFEPWQCWPILTTTLQPAGDNFSEDKAAGTCSWPGILINSKEKIAWSSIPLKYPSNLACCAVYIGKQIAGW